MGRALENLAQLGTPNLAGPAENNSVPSALAPLLKLKNGFYAFESALLVRPVGGGAGSLEWWNASAWRAAYSDVGEDCLFFAEDVFGFQFVLKGSGFYSFDPESGEFEWIGSSVEAWAAAILDDYELMTGCALGHDWQRANGPLRRGYRLAPAVPFVLGGAYEVNSLRAKADEGLANFRADVYRQIKELPDGAQIKLTLDDR